MRTPLTLVVSLAAVAVGACSSSSQSDTQYRASVVSGMRTGLIGDLTSLVSASKALQAAAPGDHGWDATADAAALAQMRTAWTACRTAYEHIEGATAPIFPDIDVSIDSRYEDFLSALPAGDPDLFDDQGVTGMHAVERIVYSDVTPARVVAYESMLPGYVPARFPSTAAEANEFKTELLQKQIDDAQKLHDDWEAATNYDLDAAYQGLVSLMNEQREKVDKASSNQEESRYSQHTMADIRDNLAGTERVYALFQPWLRSKHAAADAGTMDGTAIDAAITQGFSGLQALYGTVSGDAIPQPPDDWSSENPTVADQQTAFGQLFEGVSAAVDPDRAGSIVGEMNQAAALLQFEQL